MVEVGIVHRPAFTSSSLFWRMLHIVLVLSNGGPGFQIRNDLLCQVSGTGIRCTGCYWCLVPSLRVWDDTPPPDVMAPPCHSICVAPHQVLVVIAAASWCWNTELLVVSMFIWMLGVEEFVDPLHVAPFSGVTCVVAFQRFLVFISCPLMQYLCSSSRLIVSMPLFLNTWHGPCLSGCPSRIRPEGLAWGPLLDTYIFHILYIL